MNYLIYLNMLLNPIRIFYKKMELNWLLIKNNLMRFVNMIKKAKMQCTTIKTLYFVLILLLKPLKKHFLMFMTLPVINIP